MPSCPFRADRRLRPGGNGLDCLREPQETPMPAPADTAPKGELTLRTLAMPRDANTLSLIHI